jgi:hypothetical protein
VKEDEIDRGYSMHGAKGFGGRSRDHLEDLYVDRKVMLKWILETGWDSMGWINVAEDRDQLWALLNTINFQGCVKFRNILE